MVHKSSPPPLFGPETPRPPAVINHTGRSDVGTWRETTPLEGGGRPAGSGPWAAKRVPTNTRNFSQGHSAHHSNISRVSPFVWYQSHASFRDIFLPYLGLSLAVLNRQNRHKKSCGPVYRPLFYNKKALTNKGLSTLMLCCQDPFSAIAESFQIPPRTHYPGPTIIWGVGLA